MQKVAPKNIQRRQFLKYLAAGTVLASAPCSLFAANSSRQSSIYYSAATNTDGDHFVSGLNDLGEVLFSTPLPARAHAIAVRPNAQEIVVFARRPEHFIFILDTLTGRIIKQIENNLPLYGHGVFSSDGKLLFTTENDYNNQQGLIGVRDASNPIDGYKRIAEFPSGGIGPHELRLLSDDKTLVVANGGILTHPDTGRSKLNLDTMSPALTYIDSNSGKVLDNYRLGKKHHQLSIRHLDVNQHDQVCFAMQYQGPRKHHFPLIGFHHGEDQLQLANAPLKTLTSMKNYCGSVCTDISGETFAVSSPRGNLITLWKNNGKFINSVKLNDGCGIASGNASQQFIYSNGLGDIHSHQVHKQHQKLANHEELRWDNHLTALHLPKSNSSLTSTLIETLKEQG